MGDANRPRPRPRPKPKVAGTTQNGAAVATSQPFPSKTTTSVTSKAILTQDEDEYFIRNRGRTTKTWENLDKLNKASEVKVVNIDSDSDVSRDEESPPSRKHKRKPLSPAWRPEKVLDRLLSTEVSSDSDEEVMFVGSSATPKQNKSKRKRPEKKRQKTRSRSITPPPEVPLHQLRDARALVQNALRIGPRPASPPIVIDDDESDEAIFSNPLLARIAQSVARHPHSDIPPPSSPMDSGQPDTVQLSVKWKPHPLNKAGQEATWVFKMNRDDNFHDLFEATAEEATILTENLVMTYKGKLIYASVTPMTLHIVEEADLVACDKTTYEYLRQNPSHASFNPEPTPDLEEHSDTEESLSSAETDDASDAGGDTFKLILRSAIFNDITVTVRPTTKCGAIIKAFLRKAGVESQYPEAFKDGKKKAGRGQKSSAKDPRLSVDGDKMGNDTEIGEADLEDGDLVEVVGL